MLIKQFFTPGLAICSYLIADETSKKAAVIDPTRHINSYMSYATQEKLLITDIIETHVHADFVSGALELKKALANKPAIHCSAMGGPEWSPIYADQLVQDKDEVILGSLHLQAWHTPGHTPEHLIWVVFDEQRNSEVPALVFTGDLLFVGSVGRPDLLAKEQETELAKQLYRSIFETLAPLPDLTELFPSHSAGSFCGKDISQRQSSTLGYERLCNPWLAQTEIGKWTKALLENMPAAPSYFNRMKKINLAWPGEHTPYADAVKVLNSKQALALLPQCTVIDLRTSNAFAAQHVKGAVNIPPSPSIASWAGAALSGNEEILLFVSAISEAPTAIEALRLLGFDNIHGVFDVSAWQHENEQAAWQAYLESTPNINVKALEAQREEMYILDVRTLPEWNSGHIKEAHLIELSKLTESMELIPKDRPIAVICHSGNRSSLAASLLRQAGFQSVFSVQGGMQAWQKGAQSLQRL